MELDQLDHLAAQADQGAAALDAPMAPDGTVATMDQGPDFMGEARAGVDMFAALVVGYAPKAEPLWNDGAKQRVAAALAPVMEKYSFSFGSMPPELTLLVVAGPLLWQTSRVIGLQMAEEKAKAKAAQAEDATARAPGEAQPAPGEPASAPAPAVHPQMALYASAR